MIQMLPTYTLEKLQDTDIDLLLPLYQWYCKQMSSADKKSPQTGNSGDIVYRNGKAYKKVTAKSASWADKIF